MAPVGAKRPLEEQTASKANAAPAAKKGRKPKVPAEIKLQPIKKTLNGHVKTLARMVNRDWHDGYEEQGEELAAYLGNLSAPLQAVYDVGIVQNTAHGACHDVLMCIADTWENMKSIPARCDIEETAKEMGGNEIQIALTKWGKDATKTFSGTPVEPLAYMWRLLLQSAAANAATKDENLLQWIKDATDYEAEIVDEEEPDDDKEELLITDVDARMKAGLDRVTQLHAQEDKWKTLPTHKKVHKTKRAIDRRFDGPKHMRTRDYSDDEFGFW